MNKLNCVHTVVSLLLLSFICLLSSISSQPIIQQTLIIDAAPSVVSYQGSSQNYAHLVISPRGRALGYVAPTNLNHTVHHTEKVKDNLDFLDIRPIYMHN
ncbi:uncharacterized protein LOC111689472 [Lucilia cuprina]|uniref:uncharacterized protein LOC111689472 n=1 Tax=Lucilia cuprina TaxID=7375 RepID=UPI001F05FAE6|nr:uncharacterized protein LOC111689472 [Lucilia cuprina]